MSSCYRLFNKFVSYFYFFFFQAEDGIRDLTVTGVQTCALPISGASRCAKGLLVRLAELSSGNNRVPALMSGFWNSDAEASVLRSEERRVGKECRSRWSPYH